MIEKVNGKLEYQRLTDEEKEKRHILGVLMGPCASVIVPTRNKHLYDEQTWENVFNDPIVKEQFANGGIFGEAGHPADRDETEIEKIAIVMPEAPKKDSKGRLIGIWHILDTPCGRILKTLCDYGYKIGISSRGNGDSIGEDADGTERVDPDSYTLHAFDAVIVPALKDARLTMVEGLDSKKTLAESLNAVINNENNEDNKKAMKESLANLNVTLTSEMTGEKTKVTIPVEVNRDGDGNTLITQATIEDGDDVPTDTIDISDDVAEQVQEEAEKIKEAPEETDEVIEVNPDDVDNAGDAGNSMLKDLQDALRSKQEVQKINEGLQERLSAGCAREQALAEAIGKYKAKIAELVEKCKVITGLTAKATKLEGDCTRLGEELDRATKSINLQRLNISKLESLRTRSGEDAKKWHETLEESTKTCAELKEQIKTLKRENAFIKQQTESVKHTLEESYQSKASKSNTMNEQLARDNKALKAKLTSLSEAYAKELCDAYGIDPRQVTNQLTDYTPKEINKLVESIQQRRGVSRALPFLEGGIKKVNYTFPTQSNMGTTDTFDADSADEDTVRMFTNMLSDIKSK